MNGHPSLLCLINTVIRTGLRPTFSATLPCVEPLLVSGTTGAMAAQPAKSAGIVATYIAGTSVNELFHDQVWEARSR